eukprot:NODE_858_length_1808_cov_50.301011_g803_i0.p1 GENE.NODE_858_length_1808_cov_50.301011_g803_i0~~NODE_858_length_1808_cov_50.301011_g803_i0.p1  ORF type:complete len:563 (+),score=125.34 NODE_858_length_1808_cov_50.301011_g803_i0:71-1690(+)
MYAYGRFGSAPLPLDETHLNRPWLRQASMPLLAVPSLLALEGDHLEGKGTMVSALMFINAVVGAGVLGVPRAFAEAGVGFSVLFLAFLTLVAYITACWFIEVQSRMQALVNITSPTLTEAPSQTHSALIKQVTTALENRRTLPPPFGSDFQIHHGACVFEIGELCAVFLGSAGQHVWEVAVLLYIYASLWMYCAVVATTLVTLMPLSFLPCAGLCVYRVWLGVLCGLSLPLCFTELVALVRIQLALNFVGSLCIFVMLATSVAAMFILPCPGVPSSPHIPYIADQPLFRLPGFALLFTTTVFTQMGHFAIPSITVIIKNKRSIQAALGGALVSTALLYALLGSCCALYFGDEMRNPSILNWRHFTFSRTGDRPLWLQILCTMVVAAPIFTISCAYPLYVHALATNILNALPVSVWRLVCAPEENGQLVGQAWPPLRVKLAARLLAILPPYLFAFLLSDPSDIVMVAGLFGFFIMFFIPAALQYTSIRKFKAVWRLTHIERTPFHSWHSSLIVVGVIMALALVGFVFSAYETVRHLLQYY